MRIKPLRILELNFERGWRGGERQTLYNMTGFADAGIGVSLLCRKNCALEEKAREAGFTTYAFANIFGILYFLMRYGRHYNILHVQTSHILTYAVLAKPFHRAKIVFTRRVDFVPHGRFTRLKYRLTDKVIAISTAIKRILEDFGVENVTVISSAIVKKELNASRAIQLLANLPLAPTTKILGTTAALVDHKDPFTMVDAIAELAAKRKDFVFLHFGKGALEIPVRERIAALGLQDHYKLMGFHDNVEDVFTLLDVFVMSSEQEGLGSSVLDAFLYKVPVVGTNAGGLPDLLGEGRGILCPVKSPKALAAGIHTLLTKPRISEEQVRIAYQFAFEQHNLKYLTHKYLSIMYHLQGVPFPKATKAEVLY
ncbi:Glycosyltransferase involved in cell wall bisynthesis [Chitinophaga costaii]|uniref:Glycosyltransferase involved in cell wall bisynthesis n=1 Tax=Chitinophaga costaii TaxID=1335309 RepID=A0A1C4FDG1_9BACT|nr:glycosyltransferase [Chitinophaga costaii]PUZ20684.1 glycosyltransferase family 1 protein [Chitinophaga costaii]SCC53673.1 Glycosyltransferase involved in cell wall bisynthesis [Chitinophaga costaii]